MYFLLFDKIVDILKWHSKGKANVDNCKCFRLNLKFPYKLSILKRNRKKNLP